MTLEFILEAITLIRKLITIIGDRPLSEAVSWLEVRANAEKLRLEVQQPLPETEEVGETDPGDE